MSGGVVDGVRAERTEGRLRVVVPKTGLATYDALRAYGTAIAIEGLAVALRLLSFPEIRDEGHAYTVVLRDASFGEEARDMPELLARAHPVLALLRALGSDDPAGEARGLGGLLQELLEQGRLRSDRRWTLQAVIEPGAVKAPRGGSRLALQERDEMLAQLERPEREGVALAYLAGWGRVSPPRRGRWRPGLGLFCTVGGAGEDVVRLLPVPEAVELRHERDPGALADVRLWGGSETGAACHLLLTLGLRGGLGPKAVLVDRLRGVRGGRWQPTSWGVVRARGIEHLAATVPGHRALRSMHLVFEQARGNESTWGQAAHALTRLLLQPGVESLAGYLRAAAGAAARTGQVRVGGFDEEAMQEVMRMTGPPLSSLYKDESIRDVGRSLRKLLDATEAWGVYEAFVAARAPEDLARALQDLLREVASANRAARRNGARPVWVPGEDALGALMELAERYGAESVGVAIASYALAGPPRAAQPVAGPGEEEVAVTESGVTT
jgi:hypothetical protein